MQNLMYRFGMYVLWAAIDIFAVLYLMADTVKKSRIVSEPGDCLAAAEFSDDDASLQDIINEEFNQRLKNCMRDESYLEPNEGHIALTYEPGEVVLKNGDLKAQIIQQQQLHQQQQDQQQQQELQHEQEQEQYEEQEPTLDLTLATNLETTSVLKTNEVLNRESPTKESVNGSITKNISQEKETEELEEGLTSHLIKEDPSDNNEHSTNGLNHNSNHSNHEEAPEPFQIIDQEASPEDSFVNKEVPSPEDEIESPFDNVTVTDVDNENLTAKERFLSTVKDIEEEDDASLRQNSSDTLVITPDQISPVKNEEILPILQDISAKTTEGTEETTQEDQISKPDNLELIEVEATDDVSEISAENEVCNKLESSNSEDLSESLKNEDLQDETHENQENIKDITSKFITNEISEIDGDLSASKYVISSDRPIYKSTPTIVEHLVEDIDPDNDEIIEDYSLPPAEDKQEVCAPEKTEIIEDTSSDIPEIIPSSEEITEEPPKTEEAKSSPSKVSEISKIFTPKESEDLKEEIKSPILDETFEDIKKISKIFSPKESDDSKEEIKSPVMDETFEDIKKISKIFSPKEEDVTKEEIKSPVLEETFEDIKKISKIFSPKEDVTKEEIKSPVLEETFEDIKKISKIFSPKEEDITKEEIKSPVLEETFEDIKKISKIFSPKEEDVAKEEIKSPVLDETFEDIKKTKEIFERISIGSEESTTVLKSSELIKRLSDPISPGSDASECSTNLVCRNSVSTTVTSESSFVETRTENNSNQDKVLKKKKSKKSKKDNEKENISVCDYTNTNDEDNLSHVSVKNLCRSFSDLTSIGSKNVDVKLKTRIAYGRAKSMSDIRREDVNLENVFSNVSVKSLRECFDNLTNRTNHSFERKTSVNNDFRTVIKTSDRIEKLKSSFSKFDALQKKTVLHVRSSDSGKAQEKFNGTAQIDTSSCKSCGKQVFQMEQMKAEKAIWHKNCFRCQECNKQLNVDTYQSNEGVLYCKPHFKALFTPKAVEDEPQPTSDKPDLGLEELQNLNVKERFQVFEHHENQENSLERTPSSVNVKRSPSILSKLAKFQSKGMDIGVGDDSLNGVPVEESSSEEEEEEEEIEGEDAELVRARRAQREKPMHFSNMSDVMSKWESGNQMTKEERREERKQEIQSIRSRLFMGKQAKIKEMYQQAVLDSSSGAHVRKQVPLDAELSESARSLRERFERGEQLTSAEQQTLSELDDAAVFETGISKKSRSIFLELDANASKPPSLKVVSPGKGEVRRAREPTTPSESPPPTTDSDDTQEASAAHTATRMLSVFRQMEESAGRDSAPAGPKPLKRFTPPPEPQRTDSDSEEEYSEEEDEEDDEERRVVDEDLIEAQKAARAKQLRAKFEKWEANEIKREQNNSSVNIAEEMADADSQIESAKSLRARFESMRESPSDKERSPRVKVNRFVDTTNNVETCKSCEGRVYPLEKVSCHNNVYHKNCFRCRECNTVLRMDSYTYNQGLLYCLPHFKRLFIAKGNYEAGFGLDQHKEKWNTVS